MAKNLFDGLIGYSGFVGGNLDAQHSFVGRFNSQNIGEACGQSFGTVVCAAAPGSMFEANRFPERDAQRIADLTKFLSQISTQRMVLISTIAVLSDLAGGDDEATNGFQMVTPYGVNRRSLEIFCANHFKECLILRLPALFGPGLRKNFLFDLLNPLPSMLTTAAYENVLRQLGPALRAAFPPLYAWADTLSMHVVDRDALARSELRGQLEAAFIDTGIAAVGFTNPESQFQYYNMARLWRDIERALDAGLRVLHAATEPLTAGEVHLRLVGKVMPRNKAVAVHREDMRTAYADLWDRVGGYIDGKENVLDQLEVFYSGEKARS